MRFIDKLETERLIAKRLKDTTEAARCYKNFYCSKKTAKYMLWKPTENIEEAKIKISNWSKEQEDVVMWFIYEKSSMEPIGFFGVQKLSDTKYGEIVICFGEKFVGKGYGYEIMIWLINYLKTLGAKEVEYSYLEGNIASKNLAEKLGFKFTHVGQRFRKWDSKMFNEYFYVLKI